MTQPAEHTLQVQRLAPWNSFPSVGFPLHEIPLSCAGFLIGIEKGARVNS